MLTKILVATAENGKVSIEAGQVPDAKILSAGKAKSNGILIISEDNKVYIAIPMDSIGKILDLLKTALETITATSLGTPTQGWSVAPTLPTELVETIQAISDLKGNLQ